MNRTEKQELIDELHKELESSPHAVLVDFQGLSVPAVTEFRKRMRASGSRYRVVKNSLALRAAKGTALEQLESKFEGTTGIAYTGDDPVALAKVLVDFAKDHPALARQGGRRLREPGARRRGRQGPQHDARACRRCGRGCSACCRPRRPSSCGCSAPRRTQLARVMKAHQDKLEGN